MQRKKKSGQPNVAKTSVMKCIVKLRFKAFGNVRNYTNDENNSPECYTDLESDGVRKVQKYWNFFRNFFRCNTSGRKLQVAIQHPAGELSDLTEYRQRKAMSPASSISDTAL